MPHPHQQPICLHPLPTEAADADGMRQHLAAGGAVRAWPGLLRRLAAGRCGVSVRLTKEHAGLGLAGVEGVFANACLALHGPIPNLPILPAAQQHKLEHEVLSPAQVAQRFSAYRLPQDFQSLYEPGAGFLAPEKCIAAHLSVAKQRGAQLVCDAAVSSWAVEPPAASSSSSSGSGSAEGLVRVETSQGTFQAKKLVLAPGGWMPALVPELKVGRRACRWLR